MAALALDGVLAGGLHGRSERPGLWAFRRHLKEEDLAHSIAIRQKQVAIELEAYRR